jgi:hypothetical protein
LKSKLHTNTGVDFYSNSMLSMLEHGPVAERPWVGVLHATPEKHIEKVISESPSMKKCLGVFGLSEYVCNFLRSITDKKISRIHLALEKPMFQFNPDLFLLKRPKVATIGHWMRRLESIFELNADGYQKVILKCSAPEAPDYEQMLGNAIKFDVKIEDGLDRNKYEKFFERNIVFLNLIDSSANNTVIECIVHRTPILINRLPALEEHLGREYPLFYENIEEASQKIADKNLVLLAHEHLKRIDTEPHNVKNFASELSESEVYKCLPSIKL